MTRVDRNVLRLGTWELLHRPTCRAPSSSTRPSSWRRSTAPTESSAFVNGVLNQIARESRSRRRGRLMELRFVTPDLRALDAAPAE
jgi:hypothetical protein